MTHAELVARAARWLRKSQGCSVVFTEFRTYCLEFPDAIGWSHRWSVLVECKASRADFLRDRDKPVRRMPDLGMGLQRYYMSEPGVVKETDLPEKWGLLWVESRRVQVIRKSAGFAHRAYGNEIGFLVSMLRRAQLKLGPDLNEWLRGEQSLSTPPADSERSSTRGGEIR